MLRSAIDDVCSTERLKTLRVIMHRGHDVKDSSPAGGRPAAKTMIEALPSQPDAQFKQRTPIPTAAVLQGLPMARSWSGFTFEPEQKSQATAWREQTLT
jgi:hypothetical protein